MKEAIVYLKDTKSGKGRLLQYNLLFLYFRKSSLNPLDGIVTSTEEFEKAPQDIIQIQLVHNLI